MGTDSLFHDTFQQRDLWLREGQQLGQGHTVLSRRQIGLELALDFGFLLTVLIGDLGVDFNWPRPGLGMF